jgi:hypothetical protein
VPLVDALVGLISAFVVVVVPAFLVTRGVVQLVHRIHARMPETTAALGSALAGTTSGLGIALVGAAAPPVIAE